MSKYWKDFQSIRNNLVDSSIYAKYFLKSWAEVGRMLITTGPWQMMARARRFEWIKQSISNQNRLIRKFWSA